MTFGRISFLINYPKFLILSRSSIDWKLLLICIVNANEIRKKVPILQVGVSSPATPIPPVIRVVLLHSEEADTVDREKIMRL